MIINRNIVSFFLISLCSLKSFGSVAPFKAVDLLENLEGKKVILITDSGQHIEKKRMQQFLLRMRGVEGLCYVAQTSPWKGSLYKKQDEQGTPLSALERIAIDYSQDDVPSAKKNLVYMLTDHRTREDEILLDLLEKGKNFDPKKVEYAETDTFLWMTINRSLEIAQERSERKTELMSNKVEVLCAAFMDANVIGVIKKLVTESCLPGDRHALTLIQSLSETGQEALRSVIELDLKEERSLRLNVAMSQAIKNKNLTIVHAEPSGIEQVKKQLSSQNFFPLPMPQMTDKIALAEHLIAEQQLDDSANTEGLWFDKLTRSLLRGLIKHGQISSGVRRGQISGVICALLSKKK